MHAVLVGVGFALAFIGYVVERQQPAVLTREKAVAVSLFVVGEILLFGEGWWWALIGLAVPPMLIDPLLAMILRR